MPQLKRIAILLLAIICLLTGLWAGLVRIGWDIYVLPVSMHHGAIMIGGFLGTVIALEKIIPLKKPWLFIIPLLSALSVMFFFFHSPVVALSLLIASGVGLCSVFLLYLIFNPSRIYVLMFTGAVCWTIGSIVLLTQQFYPLAVSWWMAFTLFIIVSERLELMKFLPVTNRNKNLFTVVLLTFLPGVVLFHGYGNYVCGVALICISAWLMRFDLIGITLKKRGLTQYVAIALLTGYCSLFISGIFFITLTGMPMGYDALVHTYFIGFIFAMIFAHGPIIIPGVLGLAAKLFHRILYLWLFLLQASWIIRVYGDVSLLFELRKMSGFLTAIAIVGYFISMAVLTARSRTHAKIS